MEEERQKVGGEGESKHDRKRERKGGRDLLFASLFPKCTEELRVGQAKGEASSPIQVSHEGDKDPTT